jgi:hypothetical protein
VKAMMQGAAKTLAYVIHGRGGCQLKQTGAKVMAAGCTWRAKHACQAEHTCLITLADDVRANL